MKEIRLQVADVTGSHRAYVHEVPSDVLVSELIEELVARMRLSGQDHAGRPLLYQMSLERDGRHLLGSERLAEVIRTGDHVVLEPDVEAGARAR